MLLKVDISNTFLGILLFCVIKAQFCYSGGIIANEAKEAKSGHFGRLNPLE